MRTSFNLAHDLRGFVGMFSFAHFWMEWIWYYGPAVYELLFCGSCKLPLHKLQSTKRFEELWTCSFSFYYSIVQLLFLTPHCGFSNSKTVHVLAVYHYHMDCVHERAVPTTWSFQYSYWPKRVLHSLRLCTTSIYYNTRLYIVFFFFFFRRCDSLIVHAYSI